MKSGILRQLTFNDSSSSLPTPPRGKGWHYLPHLKVRDVETGTTVPLHVFSYWAIPLRGHMRFIQIQPPVRVESIKPIHQALSIKWTSNPCWALHQATRGAKTRILQARDWECNSTSPALNPGLLLTVYVILGKPSNLLVLNLLVCKLALVHCQTSNMGY